MRTAFQSEDKIKRFTRLIFGANSAAEKNFNTLYVRKETFLFCDGSPVGISSILLQKSINKDNAKVIAYSYFWFPNQRRKQRYLQLERECLRVLHACERNRLYLIGRHFTNDHKALVSLLNNPNMTIPLRIERTVLRLQREDVISSDWLKIR